MSSTSLLLVVVILCWTTAQVLAVVDNPIQNCQALDPSPTLTQFVDKLPIPKEIRIDNGKQLHLGIYKIKQKLHRDLPPTTLYAFGTSHATATVPGPTLVATEQIESHVRYESYIYDKTHMLTVDNTVMWANPKHGGVPFVTHLHGAECDSTSDGFPDSWHTALGDYGPTFQTKNYTYQNSQRPSMLWYHDHAFGITRLNVLSGLAGFFDTRPSKKTKIPAWLPKKKFEIPLMLQDKQFFHNGSINFPNVGDSVQNHPQWCPEYFADTILVNGMVWPYLKVRPQKYRFRFLNAANARVFILSLSDPKLSFIQIGTDGGLLYKSQTLKTLTIAPAERIDCIVDFATASAQEIILNNTGPAPYPSGQSNFAQPGTFAVLKFIVEHHKTSKPDLPIPTYLRGPDPNISIANANVRQLFMVEFDDANDNPTRSLLSNHTWVDPVTEKPELGTTEIWEFINFTPDAHPMHIHLIEFKALNQQPFNNTAYAAGECQIFNTTLDTPGTCFTGPAEPPSVNQLGWKDTILSLPSYVTRIVVVWKSHAVRPFSFDATAGPGYVWHCHILDHEDNDMMRPIKMVKKSR